MHYIHLVCTCMYVLYMELHVHAFSTPSNTYVAVPRQGSMSPARVNAVLSVYCNRFVGYPYGNDMYEPSKLHVCPGLYAMIKSVAWGCPHTQMHIQVNVHVHVLCTCVSMYLFTLMHVHVHMYVHCTYMLLIQHKGSYLARCGWECFADAHNCTVYRKRHLTSGLYMYKGTLLHVP